MRITAIEPIGAERPERCLLIRRTMVALQAAGNGSDRPIVVDAVAMGGVERDVRLVRIAHYSSIRLASDGKQMGRADARVCEPTA